MITSPTVGLLQRSILLLSYAAVMVLSNESHTVIADYPPGCNNGPRSALAFTDFDTKVLNGTCVYLMSGGMDSNGTKQQSVGMLIRSNLPDSDLGEYGTLKMQWNIFEGGSSPSSFNLETTGSTQLDLGNDKVGLKLAIVPLQATTKDAKSLQMYNYVRSSFEDSVRVRTDHSISWYRLQRSTDDIHLLALKSDLTEAKGNVRSLSIDQDIIFNRVKDDRYYLRFDFTARGYYASSEGEELSFSVQRTIVEGVFDAADP
ncbi:hypothetical protein FOZ63_006315 [Perkinsus olseni]|uniref:Uncharacterized protein n=2 Tax=Perkinsus olseni TaxID=32597 RepID=A0A7J6U046_PEROL|nr:hypothetical protein FOZ63_006315 [Perkinsus olseni]